MIENLSRAFINGNLLPEEDLYKVSILSPSFQYGLSVFEGIRVYKKSDNSNHKFLVNRHIERLLESAEMLGLNLSFGRDEVEDDINQLVDYKELPSDVYIKYILAYLNSGSWSSTDSPDRICFYYSSKSCLRLNSPKKVNTKFTSFTRINPNSMPPKIKCGANYINSRFGFLDVNIGSKEVIMPLFLDQNGFVSESSGSCIFIIKGNLVITPPLTSSILESTTRNFILDFIAKKLISYKFIEKTIDRWDVVKADAAFLCGTNIEIKQINKIGEKIFPKRNEVLMNIFQETKKYINI